MIHSLQQKGPTIQLSSQCLLPTASRKSMAVILTKCWCHLVWAGEVAGIFPLAALLCELLWGINCLGFFFFLRGNTLQLDSHREFYPPRQRAPPSFLLFPSLVVRGREEQAPARPGPGWHRAHGAARRPGMGMPGDSQLPTLLRYASTSLVFINKRCIRSYSYFMVSFHEESLKALAGWTLARTGPLAGPVSKTQAGFPLRGTKPLPLLRRAGSCHPASCLSRIPLHPAALGFVE